MDIFDLIKITGALAVAAGGFAAAYMMNFNAGRSLTRTDGVISLMKHIRRCIDCYSMPADRIFADCNAKIYADCGYCGKSLPHSVSELIAGCEALGEPLSDILARFDADFGKSYREEQIKLCDRYVDELSALRTEISNHLPVQKKLNSTLCISGAMAIVILLI